MAELFNQSDLQELLKPGDGPRVSLFMPTHRSGPDVRQNAIRFKNLLARAEELIEAFTSNVEQDFQKQLDAARKLVDNDPFWQHQDQGLAMFLDGDGLRLHRVPLSLDEHVAVGEEFEVGRVLPVLRLHGVFYVLAVSEQGARVLRGTSVSISEVETDELPGSLDEVAGKDVPDSGTHSERLTKPGRGGDAGPMMRHGYHHERNSEEDLLQYFRAVDAAIGKIIDNPSIPLVFAGVEDKFPAYKEVNTHRGLVGECIAGSPDDRSDEELRDAAWELVAPHLERHEEEIANKLHAAHTENRASCEPAEILEAARMGAVATLLVTHEHAPAHRELVEAAMLDTLRSGGEVIAVSRSVVKGDGLCALYRHPISTVEKAAMSGD